MGGKSVEKEGTDKTCGQVKQEAFFIKPFPVVKVK
jgi:hypothetical protein